MKFNLKVPCDACPFRADQAFEIKRLEEFANEGCFVCHKTAEYKGSGYVPRKNGKSQVCQGMIQFNVERNHITPAMRLAEHLGLLDLNTVDMTTEIHHGTRPDPHLDRRKALSVVRRSRNRNS